MSKGMKSLTETTDLPIVNTNDDEGDVPNFLFKGDKDYGIASDDYNYILVERKNASRTIKDDNGTPIKVETYNQWIDKAYFKSFDNCLKTYCEVKDKNFINKLKKETDFNKLIENRDKTYKIISDTLAVNTRKFEDKNDQDN
jgi:tRNA uridine 5-carbamoylmethylation protein Kti12